ncbi:Rieske [2Fe-2S] iron-sulfur domain-containing protein [Aspergillus pseudonomiae]|uniref:Choline monooxygenase, chloroplastic n=1 Tax=Aspergillus pseudonomiae TaxID=1506151 RepID=A0A5N6I656_9EURO|nr:Rieske [2Fe-2S] iron-sulfur domain-containing protein [Aspergillus pseudonomiae]KAB8262191.1 Rieske [2Fe-2S] iron-sulfur domain-containing protein [Aspergillus pseudonomiae]KAE8401625.1 Rieske [2Fe-2S] iron-sulfur domain-containing protein [Aspergillus pseudonomiae]
MSSIWKNYFGQDEVASSGATPPNDESLPANWYTSPEMWELERRAIFSRKWMLITHKMRLPSTGDYLVYNIAGYPFILVRDKDGGFNAFHNVCRHRAFPVVTEQEGKARIFACKYHGWSYGLNGKLAKAPGYQDLDGFDKNKNGLFQIHVHVDNNGFIWVNLDAQEKPEIAWESDFSKVDLQGHFSGINWDEYNFDHTWDLEGEYNWKILAGDYTERYHPDTSDNVATSTPDQITRDLRIASTYYFPNASMTVSPHLFVMQRLVPTSATKSTMRYEVYRNKNSSDEDFELISQTYKRIMSEDKDLCINIQSNLGTHMEKGSLHLQTVVRELVMEHYKKEQEAGREIWPTRQTLPTTATTSEEDMTFCNKLDAQAKGSTAAGGCCGGSGCQPNATLVF